MAPIVIEFANLKKKENLQIENLILDDSCMFGITEMFTQLII
jgi:hypothetical protein